jgi:hypothetical protein
LSVGVALADFLARYAPEAPRRAPANDDELLLLGPIDGVDELDHPPARSRSGLRNDPETRHLWVLWAGGAPYVLERAPQVRAPLASGVAKHTNLTGGGAASCGGELWIDDVDATKLYVNGASGRYGPKTPKQLEDAADFLRGRGFVVVSCGWDDEAALPARVFR